MKQLDLRWRLLAAAVSVAAALSAGLALADDEEPEVVIHEQTPYVPSPKIVVDTMLDMAGVTSKDFLIDLGSGDGRIIITAAKERKARGFGVDYDDRLVKRANDNAKKEGVSDRATFLEQDIFQTDMGAADVVTIYLLPEYNAKLKPTLLALRPGTRIVSHDYGIGDWEPDSSKKIPVPDKPVNFEKASTIMMWIVPAKVAGHWRSSLRTPSGVADLDLMLTQHNQQFEGKAKLRGQEVNVERPFIKGDYVSFRIQDGKDTLLFNGHISNSRITGQAIRGSERTVWRALRTEEVKKS